MTLFDQIVILTTFAEVALAYRDPRFSVRLMTRNQRNSYNFVAFENKPVTLALSGLWGCTSVFVISKRGAWMGHFWERYFSEIYQHNYQMFIEDVLAAMDIGNVHNNGVQYEDEYGINALRDNDELGSMGHLFDDETSPKVVILAPYSRQYFPDPNHPHGGTYNNDEYLATFPAYERQLEDLTDNAWLIFGEENQDVTVQQYFYAPMTLVAIAGDVHPGDDGFNTHRGKVLIQYQPAPRECDVTSPEQRVAKYRYFIEGRQIAGKSHRC